MEFWGGTCRYDTQVQCWVQTFSVRDAHLDATVLKTRQTGQDSMPKRLEIQLFSGGDVNELDWNFHGTVPAPWPIISARFHSPGPPAPCATLRNLIIQAKRLLDSVRWRKRRDRVREGESLTCKQNASTTVDKSRLRPLDTSEDDLYCKDLDCLKPCGLESWFPHTMEKHSAMS